MDGIGGFPKSWEILVVRLGFQADVDGGACGPGVLSDEVAKTVHPVKAG